MVFAFPTKSRYTSLSNGVEVKVASPGGTEQPGRGVGGVTLRNLTMKNVNRVLKLQETMRYLITGYTLKECANLVQVSYTSLALWIRQDPEFLPRIKQLSESTFEELDREIAATRTAISDRVNELAVAALDRMEKIITEGGDTVAYKASQDILDRCPEVPRNRQVKAEVTQRIFNPADLIRAAAVADELAQVGVVVEGKLSNENTSSGQSGKQPDSAIGG